MDASGAAPERVVVMETVGGVKDFQRAVARTSLEWIGEFDEDDISPDEDFAAPGDREERLPRRLYLTIASQQAIQEMLSLWKKWLHGGKDALPKNFKLWGDVLACLRDVRQWGPQDRLGETGILEDWSERVARGDESVRCEIELWARASPERRMAAEREVRELIQRECGRLITNCAIEAISYHGVLADLPIRAVKGILDLSTSDLVRSHSVMLFRPCVQTAIRTRATDEARRTAPRARKTPSGSPVVALFDGLPIENHAVLDGRIVVDDPEGWSATYPVGAREHGTAMASLIVHGDLGAEAPALPTPLYVRPITRPSAVSDSPFEEIPADRLAVDAVHQAVRRMVDPEAGSVAATVRVVNLSLGDRWYPFHGFLSPWARLLDWLAAKYGLLFVVSAGNDTAPHFELAVPRPQVQAMNGEALQAAALAALVSSARHRAILAPAESVNALTVGASHSDAAPVEPPADLRELVGRGDLPAPYSCVGLGYRRAIKPDVLAPGGRAWYRESLTSSELVRFVMNVSRRGAGVEHACPGTKGIVDATGRTAGTSNSTALCSRSLAFAYDALQPLLDGNGRDRLSSGHEALLLRVLAVHTATWGDARQLIEPLLEQNGIGNRVREHVARFLGYGFLRPDRMTACTEQRATMLGFGVLAADEAHQFSVPVPVALGPHVGVKRFTVTLTWFSPINPRHREYRRASLWFDLQDEVLRIDRTQADWNAVKRGTIQHEIYEGQRASAVGDAASILVRVNCRALAGPFTEPVAYALACSLEVEDGVPIPVYQEVKQRLQVRVPASGGPR